MHHPNSVTEGFSQAAFIALIFICIVKKPQNYTFRDSYKPADRISIFHFTLT